MNLLLAVYFVNGIRVFHEPGDRVARDLLKIALSHCSPLGTRRLVCTPEPEASFEENYAVGVR